MRENLDQWPFVLACYAIAIAATLAMLTWSVVSMRRAERRRDKTRRK